MSDCLLVHVWAPGSGMEGGGVEGGVVVLVGIVEFLKVAGEGWVVSGITRECTVRVGWVGGGFASDSGSVLFRLRPWLLPRVCGSVCER